ncbi:nucleoside-diphosphate-sugar epimerase [Flavobacterium araucananum]|uniref:NAD(P)-binding domain-containing protein n=1 Tax=Flavobacterium araucananum TaxID=946678 RepID=A0A227P3J9_9FLAO|nr:NAD(P)H-binding protein [Flavobacterium araucananum]OXG03964.1 hypothetical protein B0A64_16580 [Flavobacterium araucananum]PWJ98473.1 nucleoside-diphosphate-sugar epimerase [Flavobacterium araucananum]
MRVLVIGSNGRVGTGLVQKLADHNYTVLAGSRDAGTEKDLQKNIKKVSFDLLWDVEDMTQVMKDNIDAVFFVSGSRGKNLLQIDLHGAVKTMQAAEKAGVKRYIMLSSVFALDPTRWKEAFFKDLTDYNIAKHYADLYLSTQTKLDYTILQPGALKEEVGSGKITTAIKNAGSNSIANVVDTLLAVLENDSTIKKVVMIHDGETPIKEALTQLR